MLDTHDTTADNTTDHAAPPAAITHKIVATEVGYTHGGPVYRVTYEGEEIIARAWEPITEAARILVARGCNRDDRIELWGREPYARLRGRLGFVATMTVIETDKEGPRWGKYRPHPGIKAE